MDNGYGYEKNGSVYFDTTKFAEETGEYGKLSGRIIEDLLTETRDNLKNQSEKKHPSDFAIWMKAADDHLMKWNSPWSVGFPGWHLECSAMSTKYLGTHFDIHGGGNDLKFPHHENEVAQNIGACNCQPSNYWLHTNMLLMNGKKMSKSDGNTISPEELFTGDSPHVSKGYSPMVVKFFMLQSHYRSTLDLNDEALLAAEKGYKRLMEAYKNLKKISTSNTSDEAPINAEIKKIIASAYDDMNDDFNTPRALSQLFALVPSINSFVDGKIDINTVSDSTLTLLQTTFDVFLNDILGLKNDLESGDNQELVEGLMDLIINIRQKARENKDWGTSDQVRDKMNELNIALKDGAEGTTWSIK
jgi:cysteinyl-tRNA synthetase